MDELSCFSEISRQRAFARFPLFRVRLENGRSLAAVAREAVFSERDLRANQIVEDSNSNNVENDTQAFLKLRK